MIPRAWTPSRLALAAIAVLLAWSAGSKVVQPHAFRQSILALGLMPDQYVTPIEYGLPVVELAAAVSLVTGILRYAGLLLSLFLCLVFAGIHAYVLTHGIVVPCGCAGVMLEFESPSVHVAWLGICTLMALLLARAIVHGEVKPRSRTHGAADCAGHRDVSASRRTCL